MGDPDKREANAPGTESYLGVSFDHGPTELRPGESAEFVLGLMYHPCVDYSALVPGATFTTREGHRVVGHGTVLSRD